MCDNPYFLKPILSLDMEISEIIPFLYSIFENDFKKNTVCYKNIKVIHNPKIELDGQGKEEGFWHVISKDNNVNNRLIDYPRAKRLHWAKPLMEEGINPEIKIWEYQEGNKDKNIITYIWLENYDYIVILQKNKEYFYWISAFYVEKWNKRELYNKYQKRL